MPFVFYHSLPCIFEIKSFIQPGTRQYGKTSFQVSLRDAFFSHPLELYAFFACVKGIQIVIVMLTQEKFSLPPSLSFFLLKFYLGMQGTQHTWHPKNNSGISSILHVSWEPYSGCLQGKCFSLLSHFTIPVLSILKKVKVFSY